MAKHEQSVIAVPSKNVVRRRFSPEYKRNLVEQTLRSDVSLTSRALASSVNTNLLARWRRVYLNAYAAVQAPALLPIHFVDIASGTPTLPVPSATAKAGEIEMRHGQAVPLIRGVPDESVLRMALQILLQTQLDSLQ